ncbi:MAG: tyrosine-type recombinase/integrase [Myxococcales bacterium]|nr:tyrosine-type recombinase/integrase [Myxococcales bacterium]
MGQVIRKTKGGRFIGWYVRYVDSDGKRKAKATKAATAAEARRILVELEAAASRRQLGIPERPKPLTGKELIDRWLKEYQPRTIDRERWVTRQRYALTSVRHRLSGIVNRADAATVVRQLSGIQKSSTLRQTVGTLKSAWRWAISVGLVDSNPWSMRLPAVEHRVEYLSREEVGRLLAAADADPQPVFAVAVRLAVYAGLRVSEVYGLRWRSVDLERGTLTIRNGYRDRPTKSRRERVIPIVDQLRSVLTVWRQRCPSQDYVCPSSTGLAADRRPEIRHLYRKASVPVPAATWHILRHTFASHFLMSGGSLLTLQRLLGHSSIAITQIYSHLSDDHIAAEMRKLNL